jgi:hypothetical protein
MIMPDRFDVVIASQILRIGGVIAIVSRVLSAQSPSPSICWTPRPAERCTGWVVTELGFESAFASTMAPARNVYSLPVPDFATRIVLTIGGMKNSKSNVATGITMTVASNEPDQYYRAEYRRRHWAGPDQGVEYSVGLTTRSVQGVGRRAPRANGVTGGASAGLGPIGIDGRADLLWGTGRPVVGLSAGVKAGGKLMPAATLGFGLYLLYGLATMS